MFKIFVINVNKQTKQTERKQPTKKPTISHCKKFTRKKKTK